MVKGKKIKICTQTWIEMKKKETRERKCSFFYGRNQIKWKTTGFVVPLQNE